MFLYHFIASIIILSILGIFVIIQGQHIISILVLMISLQGIYSITFLELWSLSEGGYSLNILDKIFQIKEEKIDLSWLEKIGDRKKDSRIKSLIQLGLIVKLNNQIFLTRKGRVVALCFHLLCWPAGFKEVG